MSSSVGSEDNSFGIASLDTLLDGIRPGDNVVWIAERTSRYAVIESRFIDASIAAGLPVIDVAVSQHDLDRERPAAVEVLDATSGGRHSRPVALTDEIERRLTLTPGAAFVIDGLSALIRRWGAERALTFFVRLCPRMLQTGALTFWRVTANTDPDFVESIRQVTQCLLELRESQLRIVKAEGRPAAVQGTSHKVVALDGTVQIVADPAAGRLARGLSNVRLDLGLTQAQLADAAGVTPSAISQAESGRRGLSLDTLIVLADRLGVSLDRLVGSPPPPGYSLVRHDRTRSTRDGVNVIADDVRVGLRSYRVDLAPGASGQPPVTHPGPAMVVVVTGLVQVSVGADTPVLRGGDVVLADRAPISGWRNLRPEPAQLIWVGRD